MFEFCQHRGGSEVPGSCLGAGARNRLSQVGVVASACFLKRSLFELLVVIALSRHVPSLLQMGERPLYL